MRTGANLVNFRSFPKTGGERGIRTLDGVLCPHTPLAGERLQPLGHLSEKCPRMRGHLELLSILVEAIGVKTQSQVS